MEANENYWIAAKWLKGSIWKLARQPTQWLRQIRVASNNQQEKEARHTLMATIIRATKGAKNINQIHASPPADTDKVQGRNVPATCR